MNWFGKWRKVRDEAMEKFQPHGPAPMSGFTRMLDSPHRIVAMIEHKGNMLVATEQRVYMLIDGAMRPLVFEITGDEKP